MNIILISSLLLPTSIGGVEVLTILLAQEFQRLGHQVTIYTGGRLGHVVRYGVPIVEIPELSFPIRLKSFLMPWYEARLKKRLKNEVEIQTADIINAVDLDSISALAGWSVIRKKFVATIQDYGLICANGLLLDGEHVCPGHCHNNKGFLCLSKRRLSIFARAYLEAAYRVRKSYRDNKLRRVSSGICVSNFVEDQIKKIHPSIKTAIIGNSIPTQWRQTNSTPISKRDIDILYAGRLETFKGVQTFLASLPEVLRIRPDTTIACVGSGNATRFIKLATSLGIQHSVSFLGPKSLNQMHSLYKKSKIVVVPSVWPEPCGRVIIEGMYHGCVVVSTNRGGSPELIRNGVNGVLVRPNDNHELARRISELLADLPTLNRIGNTAAKTASFRYHSVRIARQYIKFFSIVLSDTLTQRCDIIRT